MSRSRNSRPSKSERVVLRLAAGLSLALGLALPVSADDAAPAETANWTVFLSSGSSIAATEVHFDKNQGRYSLKLPKGGYIHLSPSAVRRVSRETSDRVVKAEPMVASSTGSPRTGAVPGSIDTSAVRPSAMRSVAPAVSADGQPLKARAAERLRAARTGLQGETGRNRRPRNEGNFTPKPGMMDQKIRQANARPKASRR